jgi:nitrate/nitrite transport system substrate-binding protein
MFKDPFDPKTLLGRGCPCGGSHTEADHARRTATAAPAGEEDRWNRVVDAAVLRAVFPVDVTRRLFLKTVGASTAMAAISSVLPLAAAREAFAQGGPGGGAPEKKDLKVGFIPITCATPIIMAHPMGFYSKHGLNVEVVKTAGWAVIRDKSLAKEYDASHMLSPMPLAISLGVGSNPVPWTMPAIENINGQAITLAIKHKDKRNPKDWKGFRFAVPFDYSMHNYLLRYYVAEAGLDPDKDISIRSVPPPEMVANLRADNLDGYLGPDPFNQRAVYDGVGFIHLLTKEMWDGHPCCAFAVSKEFASQNPNSYRALLKAIIDATAYAQKQDNRKEIAKAIAPQNYLNQPETVLEQILTGTYADGLGGVKKDPNRIGFDPFPWNQFAIWILTQMKRWGQLKADIDYAKVAQEVFLATDTAALMKEMGLTPPDPSKKTIVVMGKAFDPATPAEYVQSFAIKRS